MFKIISSLFCFGLVVSACSSELPRQETALSSKARDLIAEKDGVLAELSDKGTVSEAWADVELDQYQSRLDRLREIEKEISTIHGKEGLHIHSPTSEDFVAASQEALDKVRQNKLQAVAADEDQGEEEVEALTEIRNSFLDLKDQIMAEDFVRDDLTEEELQAREEALINYQELGEAYRFALMTKNRELYKRHGDDQVTARRELLKIQVAFTKQEQIDTVVSSLRDRIEEVRSAHEAS